MKTNENKVVFIHVSNSGQKIVVQDQESANALEQALNQYNDHQWIRAAAAVTPPEFTRKFFSMKEFKVILVCGNSSFRSSSSQLSNASMLLKSGAPEHFIGQECTAYICNAKSNDQIELNCTVNFDQNGNSVLDFHPSKKVEIRQLEAWI
jgi:hypothetical protein